MSDILIVCPTHRDKRELEAYKPQGHRFHFYDYASDDLETLTAAQGGAAPSVKPAEQALNELLRLARKVGAEGVLSTDDYPGSTLASIVARELGLPGVPPEVNLLCQHKYYSRLAQLRLVPEAVPEFHLIDPRGGTAPPGRLPLFLKPAKSFFSVGARKVERPEDWPAAVRGAALPDAFFAPFNRLLKSYTRLELGADRVLAEGYLAGDQVTVEGWCRRGRAGILGVVDSVFFPGTRSFKRFDYPSRLPEAVQARMTILARGVMEGLDYGDGLFNIELMHDPDTGRLGIIEINPRMSSQFADLFEKVDGVNSYALALDLALGRPPSVPKRAGRHAAAASCVLRAFEDRKLLRVPSEVRLDALRRAHPDIRIELLATEGLRLSEQMQDPESYRYGIVNLGGASLAAILEAFEDAERRLDFVFAPV